MLILKSINFKRCFWVYLKTPTFSSRHVIDCSKTVCLALVNSPCAFIADPLQTNPSARIDWELLYLLHQALADLRLPHFGRACRGALESQRRNLPSQSASHVISCLLADVAHHHFHLLHHWNVLPCDCICWACDCELCWIALSHMCRPLRDGHRFELMDSRSCFCLNSNPHWKWIYPWACNTCLFGCSFGYGTVFHCYRGYWRRCP